VLGEDVGERVSLGVVVGPPGDGVVVGPEGEEVVGDVGEDVVVGPLVVVVGVVDSLSFLKTVK
jgi:hypothetical protein